MSFAKVVATLLFFAGPMLVSATPTEGQKPSQEKQQKRAAKSASMTGCVDQQDGRYVLIDDRSREPIADLEADGFPTEGFAKHVGQKVTVRGISNPGGSRPLFRVRTIETVSENCGPGALE